MSVLEKLLFLSGLTVVWGYPLPFFWIGERWFLLALYLLTNTAFFMTLKMFLCSHCMNFACPLNSVGEVARNLFFQRNPSVAENWKQIYPELAQLEPKAGLEKEK
jgi:hypothetical protein